MSTTNYPSATPQSQPPKKDYKNLVIGLLALGFLGTWGYLLWNNNKQEQVQTQQQAQIAKVTDDKGVLQKNFDDALVRLDSLTGEKNQLQGKHTEDQSQIAKLKGQIRGLLGKQHITDAERKKAEELIKELNDKISNLEQQVAQLTQENQQLNTDKTALTQDKEKLTTDLQTTSSAKQELEKKVDVASTLNASNISIIPYHEKSNGKDKETSTAKKVNKLVIGFDVANRIAQTGQTDVFVCITGPDGKPVSVPALGSGTFTSREDGDKVFTAKVPVDFESGKSKSVQFAWKQNSQFQKGNYKIEIYHNGFKIGEGTKELKKGGIFG
ncbi:zinc ribbon domain-containing protein [Flavitalea flava]